MSELSFRLSRERDVPELTRLWREVFGDDEDFISEFFRRLWRPEYCRVAEADGKLAAMGFCLPGPVANGLSCAYIYAMATAEPYRGRCAAQRIGLELIRGAFDSGVHLVATLPAEEYRQLSPGVWVHVEAKLKNMMAQKFKVLPKMKF